MELLYSLLKLFTEAQKKELLSICKKSERAEYKLILILITQTTIDDKKLAKELKLTPATFSKTQTLSKNILVEFLKKEAQTPFDEIYVVQQLLMNGENKAAIRLYNALEKEYEARQQWNLLDVLYIEGFRIAQINGDIDFIEMVSARRSVNIELQKKYVQCYGKIMVEMLRVERFDNRKEDSKQYLKRVEKLHQEAEAIGHHVLIHNALNTLYMIYVRYFNEPKKTWQIIQKINDNRHRFKNAMNPITAAVSKISALNFLTIHSGFGNPEDIAQDCESTIDAGGVLARVNFYYAMLGYYLTEEKLDKVNYYLAQLEKVEDTTKFRQYKEIIQAVKAFSEKDFNRFKKHFYAFYSTPTHIDFPDMECMLRILELLVAYQEKEMQFYESRLQALRVYISRNLNKDRYAEEHVMVSLLHNPQNKKLTEKLQQLSQSNYRNVRFLSKNLLYVFPQKT